MIDRFVFAAALGAALALACAPRAGLCDGASPAPSPAPTASPHGFQMRGQLNAVFLTQGAYGPGLQPVEGPAFAQGAPAAPVTPYDTFSSAPIVPGNVQQNQLRLDADWREPGVSFGATLDVESLIGDRTNEAYWVEPLQPQDNPHLGSTTIGYSVVFPTHPGHDDFDGTRFGLYQMRASLLHDDALALRGGWFDLNQNLASVFTPPLTTNALPAMLVRTPESLNPNAPALDAWSPPPGTLPLRGFDLTYRAPALTFEASDAALPALPGAPARMVSVSAGRFADDGHGSMFQWIHVHTGGDPVSTTTGFGLQAQIIPTDQGKFLVSTLLGQHESIAGGKVVVPAGFGLQATAEYARSTYQADGLAASGSVQGSFTHAALTHPLGEATVGAHYYRFEPTFASMVLPYGVPENIWSVAYSWPGPWLKSTYQLVDSTTVGINREGPLFSYNYDDKQFQTSVTYSRFRQITPLTPADSSDLGFVEGFFLIQRPSEATLGSFSRTSAYVAKHFAFADVGLDFVDDGLHRDAAADAPLDAVSYDAPQYALSLTRGASSNVLATGGLAYYGMRGSWADGAATNVDYGVHVVFAGAQFRAPGGATMVAVRHSTMRGAPYFGALGILQYGSPNFTGTALIVERRFQL